jgi:hypothetical protein
MVIHPRSDKMETLVRWETLTRFNGTRISVGEGDFSEEPSRCMNREICELERGRVDVVGETLRACNGTEFDAPVDSLMITGSLTDAAITVRGTKMSIVLSGAIVGANAVAALVVSESSVILTAVGWNLLEAPPTSECAGLARSSDSNVTVTSTDGGSLVTYRGRASSGLGTGSGWRCASISIANMTVSVR